MSYTSVQKIRFDDVDGAGIVYYPRFFHLCHAAFEDFFDDAAPMSYPEMIRDRRLGFPTVHIDSDFKAPLAYGDVAIIEMDVRSVGTASLQMGFSIRRKRDGALCMEAVITSVMMNLDTEESTPIIPELRTIFENYFEASKR